MDIGLLTIDRPYGDRTSGVRLSAIRLLSTARLSLVVVKDRLHWTPSGFESSRPDVVEGFV